MGSTCLLMGGDANVRGQRYYGNAERGLVLKETEFPDLIWSGSSFALVSRALGTLRFSEYRFSNPV